MRRKEGDEKKAPSASSTRKSTQKARSPMSDMEFCMEDCRVRNPVGKANCPTICEQLVRLYDSMSIRR